MVIKIHQVASTENALMYNEKKVKEEVATFFDSKNTYSVNPFMYNENHRLKNLLDIEKMNPRVKNKCLHISFNPSIEDYLKINDTIIRQEIGNMMEHMGYGNQPYFVYKHKDLERVHFHIVSTRIDCETGRKIKDNYEKRKMQQFIKELEQKYQLTQKEIKEKPDFLFSPRSRNYKQNLENLFKHLNGLDEITSKEMYDQALKIFNVEIKKSGRGHIVVVTDDFGKPIRYPIRLSNFKEGPKFYKSLQAENESQINKQVLDKFQIAQWVRDLNKLFDKNKLPDSGKMQKLKRNRKKRPYF
jgi:hypothetical protein